MHAALLPYVLATNAPFAGAAVARAGRALGGDPAGVLWDLARATGASTSLAAVGLTEDGAERAVALVAQAPPPNPAPVDAALVRAVLAAALEGRRPGGLPSGA